MRGGTAVVGITPNAKNHAGLPPKASRFVDVSGLPWEGTRFPGVETKTLFIDKATGSVTVLIRMAPGARLPDHEHPLAEQSFVLEGGLVGDDGRCEAGDFVWRPAGSRHEAWSPEGCLVLGIFQVPNRFFERGGKVADILGQEWDATWGEAGNLKAAL
jgi:anti-sigma factor ChrR (cupin superfamily)